jgi:hypothetical protein
MRHLVTNGPQPAEGARAIASAAWPSPASADAEYRTYVRAHLRARPILAACAIWGVVLLCYFILLAPAKAQSLPDGAETLTPAVCYDLVQDAGRMIAWARWERGFPLEKTRSAPFPPNTPPSIVALVQDWITDAYQWQPTDEQVLQWASELGNTDDLPSADQLSRHETIAIWMRRIARQCTARSA